MSDQERIAHWEGICNTVVDAHKRVSDAVDAAIKAGCMDPNGPLFEAIWKSFDEMLGIADDEEGWINWFVNENESGKKAMKAGWYCDMRPITNSRELAELIVAEFAESQTE